MFSSCSGGNASKKHMYAYIRTLVNEMGLVQKNSLAGITAATWRGFMKKRVFLLNTGVVALARKATASSCSAVPRNTECCARRWLHGACGKQGTLLSLFPAWSILVSFWHSAGLVQPPVLHTSLHSTFHLRDSSFLTEGWTLHTLQLLPYVWGNRGIRSPSDLSIKFQNWG